MGTALMARWAAELLSVVGKIVSEADFASSVFDRLGRLGLIMPHSQDSGRREPHPHGSALVVLAALLRQRPAGMDVRVS
jgi:hypothetical protein